MRIIIIGNSGSGKTYLAHAISHRWSIPVFHLDEVFWEPGGFNQKRTEETKVQKLDEISQISEWIIEGVFGELVEPFLEKAAQLIWLDMDWSYCQSNLLQRGSESSQQLNPKEAERNSQRFLNWASKYWERQNLRSHAGHERLFNEFHGQKYRLTKKFDVDKFIISAQPSPSGGLRNQNK